jgi:hypothetical protein
MKATNRTVSKLIRTYLNTLLHFAMDDPVVQWTQQRNLHKITSVNLGTESGNISFSLSFLIQSNWQGQQRIFVLTSKNFKDNN